MSRRSSASARALTWPSKSSVPRYCRRIPVERMSRSSERMMPLVMANVQVPALARLLPRPGTMPLSTSEKMPKRGMSQIRPSRRGKSPWPFQVCTSGGVRVGDDQGAPKPAFEAVGLEEQIRHQRLQERVGGGHGELVVRLPPGLKVELGGAGGLAAVEVRPGRCSRSSAGPANARGR